ncbi:cingulin-like isoform X2 [Amia ocellicauda]|uniref:cingulin-like isoform X2 n=1 Tax=Amia ocellicauda TaxID=2972642 RepID=UPI0034643AF1
MSANGNLALNMDPTEHENGSTGSNQMLEELPRQKRVTPYCCDADGQVSSSFSDLLWDSPVSPTVNKTSGFLLEPLYKMDRIEQPVGDPQLDRSMSDDEIENTLETEACMEMLPHDTEEDTQLQDENTAQSFQPFLKAALEECKNTVTALHQTHSLSMERAKRLQQTLEMSETERMTAEQRLKETLEEYEQQYQRDVKSLEKKLQICKEQHNDQLLKYEGSIKLYQVQVQSLQKTLENSEIMHQQEVQKVQETLESSQTRVQFLEETLSKSMISYDMEINRLQEALESSRTTIQFLEQTLDKSMISYNMEMNRLQKALEKSQKKVQVLEEMIAMSNLNHLEEMQKAQQKLSISVEQTHLHSHENNRDQCIQLHQGRESAQNLDSELLKRLFELALPTSEHKEKRLLSEIESLKSELSDSERRHQETMKRLQTDSEATAQGLQRALKDCQNDLGWKMNRLMQALQSSMQEHKDEVLGLQNTLEGTQEQTRVLQQTLDVSLMEHRHELKKMQEALTRNERQVAEQAQQLQSHVVTMEARLLEEKSKSIEELRKAVEAQRQEDMRNMRSMLMDQREEALEQKALQQSLLSLDTERHHRARLRTEFLELKTSLCSLTESYRKEEDLRKLQEKTQDWEGKAAKLMESLCTVESCQVLERAGSESGGSAETPVSTMSYSPPTKDTTAYHRDPLPHSLKSHHRSQTSPDSEASTDEYIRYLVIRQQRLQRLQTESFQKDYKHYMEVADRKGNGSQNSADPSDRFSFNTLD